MLRSSPVAGASLACMQGALISKLEQIQFFNLEQSHNHMKRLIGAVTEIDSKKISKKI